MWALMPMLRCRGPPSVLMYRAATALAAEDEARADARDDGAALRTAAEERPPKRPVDAAATAASADAGRWANARRRRAAAAMMVVGGQEGRKNDVCSILFWFLRFCVAYAWRTKARREQIYGKRRGREEDVMMRRKGRLLPSNGTVAVFFARSEERGAKRESGPVYRYISFVIVEALAPCLVIADNCRSGSA